MGFHMVKSGYISATLRKIGGNPWDDSHVNYYLVVQASGKFLCVAVWSRLHKLGYNFPNITWYRVGGIGIITNITWYWWIDGMLAQIWFDRVISGATSWAYRSPALRLMSRVVGSGHFCVKKIETRHRQRVRNFLCAKRIRTPRRKRSHTAAAGKQGQSQSQEPPVQSTGLGLLQDLLVKPQVDKPWIG